MGFGSCESRISRTLLTAVSVNCTMALDLSLWKSRTLIISRTHVPGKDGVYTTTAYSMLNSLLEMRRSGNRTVFQGQTIATAYGWGASRKLYERPCWRTQLSGLAAGF